MNVSCFIQCRIEKINTFFAFWLTSLTFLSINKFNYCGFFSFLFRKISISEICYSWIFSCPFVSFLNFLKLFLFSLYPFLFFIVDVPIIMNQKRTSDRHLKKCNNPPNPAIHCNAEDLSSCPIPDPQPFTVFSSQVL